MAGAPFTLLRQIAAVDQDGPNREVDPDRHRSSTNEASLCAISMVRALFKAVRLGLQLVTEACSFTLR